MNITQIVNIATQPNTSLYYHGNPPDHAYLPSQVCYCITHGIPFPMAYHGDVPFSNLDTIFSYFTIVHILPCNNTILCSDGHSTTVDHCTLCYK